MASESDLVLEESEEMEEEDIDEATRRLEFDEKNEERSELVRKINSSGSQKDLHDRLFFTDLMSFLLLDNKLLLCRRSRSCLELSLRDFLS